NPKVRNVAYQLLLCGVIAVLVYGAVANAIENLRRAKIASGFDFWNYPAGFDISQSLIDYSSTSTYGRAFWVGLCNTLLVAGLGIVLATIVGFTVGIARLSKNWLVARLAGGYVEEIRDSLVIPGGFLNNRGLFIPQPVFHQGFGAVLAALLVGIAGSIAFRIWARKRQERTGAQAPVLWVALGLIVGLPLVVFVLAGSPIELSYPEKGRFSINGGIEVLPELVALLFG